MIDIFLCLRIDILPSNANLSFPNLFILTLALFLLFFVFHCLRGFIFLETSKLVVEVGILPPVGGGAELFVLDKVNPRDLNVHGVQFNVKSFNVIDKRLKNKNVKKYTYIFKYQGKCRFKSGAWIIRKIKF